MRIFRWAVRLCAGLGLLTLGASFLGAVHPLGDSLAVFRSFIAYGVAGLGLLAFVLRLWGAGFASLGVAIAAVLHIASFGTFYTPAPNTEPDAVVYAKNLGAGRTDWSQLAADIAESEADIVLLQEVTQATAAALSQLLPDHPFQHICDFSGWSAMAVVSRYPLSGSGCTSHRSLAYAVVDAPSGLIWAASIHQVWPYPKEQAALLPAILATVEAAPARQIIAGDFNMVPWGHSVQAILAAGGLRRISPVLPTIEVRGVELPIDHVLTDGQGTATRRARLGSDHFGMSARIVWE